MATGKMEYSMDLAVNSLISTPDLWETMSMGKDRGMGSSISQMAQFLKATGRMA